MSNSILDNMPPDEREALLARLRDILAPKAKTVRDAPAPDLRCYWLVSNGAHSTVVDIRDAASEEEAIRIARTSIVQAWYLVSRLADAITVRKIPHDEYVEWLRRD